jgi:hypothetical protein
VLVDFIESTAPAEVDPEDWRKALKVGRRS